MEKPIFEVGDRVQLVGTDCIGTIKKYDEGDDLPYYVCWDDGDTSWITAEYLIPYRTPLDEKDVASLIDLALATKDESWFMELTERRKGVAV